MCFASGCGLVLDFEARDEQVGADAGGVADAGRGDANAEDAGGIGADGGGVVVDAGDVDGGPFVRPACGGPSVLRDSFDDVTRSPFWTVRNDASGGSVERESGAVVTTPAPGVAGAAAAYLSTFGYDARADRIAIEVVRVSGTPGVQTIFGLTQSDPRGVGIVHDSGRIGVRVGSTDIGGPPYDAAAHRWWQVRTDGTTLFFETSADGASWVPLVTTALPAYMEGVHVVFGTRARVAVTSPEPAVMDNFNFPPDPTFVQDTYCPAHTFSDLFDDSALDANRWVATGDTCTISEGMGSLKIEASMADGSCALVTRHGYTLSSSEAVFERDALAPADSWVLGLWDVAGTLASVYCSGGALAVSTPDTTDTSGACPTERYWRLEVRAGQILLSVSADGLTWVDRIGAPLVGFDARVVRIGVAPSMSSTDGTGVSAYHPPPP